MKHRPAEYLITGLPRMRSAWLSAVLSSPSLPCIHARDDFPGALDCSYGLSDPSAACLWPEQALVEFKGKPVVVVKRNADEAKFAFARMMKRGGLGHLSPQRWAQMVENAKGFAALSGALICDYASLDRSDVVLHIAIHVGVDLSIPYIDHMQTLDIQQHEKCLTYVLSRHVQKHL